MRIWLRLAVVVLACVTAGVLLAWLLFVTWLHAPSAHVREAIWYLASSGLVSLAAGVVAMVVVARLAPSLWVKIVIAVIVGSAAAIIAMIYTPLLMFSESSDKNILIIQMLFFLALSFAFAFLVASFTTRQIRELRDGTRRLAAGEFGTTVAVQGSDEVAELARTFNHMSSELAASFERQREMDEQRRELLVAVSHDLRTPLSAIRAMVEAINDRVVTEPEVVARYLCLVQQKTELLGQLIDDLFELSRIESGSLELRLTSVPLTDLVLETVDSLRLQAQDKGVDLLTHCGGDVPPLALDAGRMQRVLTNLVENAVRHTPSGGRVDVSVERQNGLVELAITDTGEGIAPEDRPHVFERFYRGEKSRSRESGGAGLGLAIARGIVEAHHGTIRVESAPGSGARFVVSLTAGSGGA